MLHIGASSQVGLVNELVPDDAAALEEAARKLASEMLQCTDKVGGGAAM
jgi:hypothetical protein